MIELFRKPLAQLTLEDVRAFLAGVDDDEGVTWEAKADDDEERRPPEGEGPGRLRPQTIRKGVSAFANQIGGYLIIGARWDKSERLWLLPGVIVPEPEANAWLSNVIENVRPVPRYDLKSWRVGNDAERLIAVVSVAPVDEPPCMTPQGHIYERVSGKSVRVTDPALLDRLIRRGRERRAEAETFARQGAGRVLDLPTWEPAWSVRLALAMVPVGRETDDISSRLFVPSFGSELAAAMTRFSQGSQSRGDELVAQDMLGRTLRVGPDRVHAVAPSDEATAPEWAMWTLAGLWTGAVVAALAVSARAAMRVKTFDAFVVPAWRELVHLAGRLGGYGPAHLALVMRTAPIRKEAPNRTAALGQKAEPEPPPPTSPFAKLPRGADTVIERTVGADDGPTDDVIGSMERELRRAAGTLAYESEG